MPKIVVYQEDEAREAFDKDPLEDLAWYYNMQKLEEGSTHTIAVFTMCAACTHKTACTVFANHSLYANQETRYAWFCKVCAHTYCGNAYWYPSQYDQEMMRHVALCTNLILDEIKNLPENFGLLKI